MVLDSLQIIAEQIRQCRRCRLHEQATKAVPGEGSPQARVVFVGEAPGYHEDQQGIPFCGAAGRLLEKLLNSIKLKRAEVWIGNMIKHRPPDNRDPQPDELAACQPFLDQQIAVIDPEIIVTLGRFSMNKFLPGEFISQVHGQARFVDFAGKQRIVTPMYHPAAALRNGKIMEAIKNDFQKISQFLDRSWEDQPQTPVREPEPSQLSLLS